MRSVETVPHWDHNAVYHRRLVRALPPARLGRVLDVGCGRGGLAAGLAKRSAQVDAVDLDPGMIAAARRRAPANMRCLEADIMTMPLAPASYDAIVSVSALHHLDPAPALARMASALRPGGVLSVIALPRIDLPRELPLEIVAVAWHSAVWPLLQLTRSPLVRPDEDDAPMPLRDPEWTTRQVRAVAARVLPGSRVRRLLLWRYHLVWRRPLDA